MSEQTAILEKPRGEDGRFVSATPATDAPAPSETVERTERTSSNDAAHAPGPKSYEAIRTMLNAKAAAEPSPSREEDDQTPEQSTDHPLTPPGQNKPDAEKTPPPSPDQAAPAAKTDKTDDAAHAAYGESMSKQTYDLLKRVPGIGLIDPEQWKTMDGVERMDHVQLVKDAINERKRKYNESRQTQGNPPASAALANQPPQPGSTQSRGAVEGVGVSAPQTPSAGQPAANAKQLPAEDQAILDQVLAEFGEEHVLYQSQRRLMERNLELRQALDSQDSARQQEAKAAQQQAETRKFEDSVFSSLEAKYPMLSDPAVRDKLRTDCLDYFQLKAKRQGGFESKEELAKAARDAIEFVTHQTLYPQIQKQRQQKTEQNRKRSLDGTFDRGVVRAPVAGEKPATVGGRQAMDEIAANLSRAAAQGLNGERRRQAVLPGSR